MSKPSRFLIAAVKAYRQRHNEAVMRCFHIFDDSQKISRKKSLMSKSFHEIWFWGSKRWGKDWSEVEYELRQDPGKYS